VGGGGNEEGDFKRKRENKEGEFTATFSKV
jgi:hypothetical protein